MEDDTVKVSPRRRLARSSSWLRVAVTLLGGTLAIGIGTVSAAEPDATASGPAAKGGLPPLPLFAQAATPPAKLKELEPPTFATPAPGQVVDEEDIEGENEKKKKALKVEKPECDSDGQCPEKTICVKSKCRSPQRSVSALIYYHQKGPIGYRVLAPLYYSFWRPQKQTRVLIPFFADHKDDAAKSRDIWAFPTYQYERRPGVRAHRLWPIFFYSNYNDSDNKGKAVGIMPLFWVSNRQKSTTVVIPPLLMFHHRNEAEQSSHTLVVPLLTYVSKHKQNTFAWFLGLGYYNRQADKVWGGFVPLVFHSHSPEHSSTDILPLLYFSHTNKTTGDSYATLVPWFFYSRNGAAKSRLIVTLLGGSYHNDERNEKTTVTLLPLLLHRDDPVRRFTALPPLAMWWKNKETGSSWGYVGPLFWTRDDEGGSEGLLPLYLHVSSRQVHADTKILVPLLAVLHRSPTLKFGFLGPIFGWSRPTEGASGGGVLPLISIARGPRPHVVLLPPLMIYAGNRETGSHHVSIGPIFYRWQTKGAEAGYDAGIFPLLFLSRHGTSTRQMLLPLFYHHKVPGNERLVVGPVYWDRRCPTFIGDTRAAVIGGVVPLLFWKRSPAQNYTVLFPLIWQVSTPTRSAVVVGPFFWSRQKLSAPGGAPAGERTTVGLLPLFYASRSPQSALVVGPLFGYRRTPERRTLVLGPYFETVSDPGKREQSITRAVLPLFYFHCSPGRRATVLFPLFMQVREEQTTFRSLALLYYGWQNDRTKTSAHVVLPLFWFIRDRESSTSVVGPFFYHRNTEKDRVALGLLPLFAYGRSKNTVSVVTPLGFYSRNFATERTRSAFLLFYADIARDKSDVGVFPLVFATRRGTASAVFVSPLFYHSQDPARNRSFTLLGPLYFGRRGTATYGGLAPLIYGRDDGDGSYRFMALPVLYFSHHAGKDAHSWLLTPLFGFKTASTGFRFYLGPFYVRHDDEANAVALFPLLYYGHDKKTRTTVGMVLPLFLRVSKPESSLTMVTPLFWHHRALTRHISLFFPLVLDVKNLFTSRLTVVGVVLPFMVRSRDYVNNTTTWLFPPLLTYVKHQANGYYNVISFPIFFHYGGAERSTTVVFPLFYNLKRPATRFTMLLPLFAYHRDEHDTKTWLFPPLLTWVRNYADGDRDRVIFPLIWHFKRAEQTTTVFAPFGAHWTNKRGSHTLVLNNYYYKGTGENKGAWRLELLWPLFQVGRPRPQDLQWNFLAGFIGYNRDGMNRTLRLLWLIFIPLERVDAKAAWYGASWRMASDN